MTQIQRLKAADRLPKGWSIVDPDELQYLWRIARKQRIICEGMRQDDLRELTLRILVAKYGTALYRERDNFYRPKDIKGRAIDWSQVSC